MKNKAHEKLVSKGLAKAKYKYVEPAKRDLLEVLRGYRGLAPKVEVFVFDDGDERNMINLAGTIPVQYRGVSYNIPVCFWLPPDYPAAAPLAYVQPTQDMQIKASANVDQNGRVRVPYIAEWKQPGSSLVDLIQICTLIFGQSPPVFTKVKSAVPQQLTTSFVSMPPVTASVSSTPAHPPAVRNERLCSSSSNNHNADDVDEKHLRASLLSACEEILRDKLEEEFSARKAEVSCLHSTNKELLDGQERIGAILTEVATKTTEVQAQTAALLRTEVELRSAAYRLSELDVPAAASADDVLVVSDPLQARLLDAFATDAAIEDVVYSLGEALHAGVIGCDVYLKKVRHLSRRQFHQRVLMQRCQQSAVRLQRSASTSSDTGFKASS
jgi:ESCRT-I complex subunit TSG101